MRLHRFYVGDQLKLTHDFWINDPRLIRQWQKVFRLSEGAEVVLFDGVSHDRMYQIVDIEKNGIHLKHETDLSENKPSKNIYLFWSLLKKDKNDWVLQKCTELGVNHFVPILTKRTEKTGFDTERSKRIIIEAAEQCGRSNIPTLREPMLLSTAIEDYADKIQLYFAEQGDHKKSISSEEFGILIGPEGGWSSQEIDLFDDKKLNRINLNQFTLRAETASVTAISQSL